MMKFDIDKYLLNPTSPEQCRQYADYLEKVVLPKVQDEVAKYTVYPSYFPRETSEYEKIADSISAEIESLRTYIADPAVVNAINEYDRVMSDNINRKRDWHTGKKRPNDRRHGKHRPLTRKQEIGVHNNNSGIIYTLRGKKIVPIAETDRGYHNKRYNLIED